MRIHALSAVFLASAAMAPPASAQSTGFSGWAKDCFCTDQAGFRIELGEYTCLSVDGRSFLARCDMSQNVMTWRDTGEGCVVSDVAPLPFTPIPAS